MNFLQRFLDHRRREQQTRREIGQKMDEYLVTLIDPQTLREAHDLVDQGKKILAIKRVREATGGRLGLKEAKDFVDRFDKHGSGA
ncbi:ribosomal protein L7/L12 [Dermatophilaceae bacterium Sec6.4]